MSTPARSGFGGMRSVLIAVVCLQAAAAGADVVDDAAKEAAEILQQARTLGPSFLNSGGYRSRHYVEERFVDGEQFYRMKDYHRAAIMFMDIIENHPDHMAYLDALFLFADALFLSGDYLGARDWFRRLLDTPDRPGIDQFRQRATSRLIEIAIHLDNYEGIDKYLDRLGQSLAEEARYTKGKYLFFTGKYDQALGEFRSISRDPLLQLKATYFAGVVLTSQKRFDQAIAVFDRGRQHKPKTKEEKEIVDLLNLGAGRLYFEKDFVENASACYQRVASNSIYADTALYEAASVLIRAGDAIRAEQTLEVLIVAFPDSKYIPRAKLLRGNLLLRTGQYDEAEKMFEDMIEQFTPVVNEFDQSLRAQDNTTEFFDELISRSLATLDISGALPPLVVKWVSEEPDVQNALELASDLGSARESVNETERLVRLLEAVVDGPSQINAIPSLREAKRRAQQMNNRLGQLRAVLLEIEQNELGENNEVINRLRKERQNLEQGLRALPTDDAEFEERDARSRQKYDRMHQELSRNRIRLDQLSAMIVAIERFVSNSRYAAGVSAENAKMVREELNRYRAAVSRMHDELELLITDVESARYRVGVGDSNDTNDERLLAAIERIANEERTLLRGRGGQMGQRLERLDQIHASIDEAEEILDGFEQDVQEQAAEQIAKITSELEQERRHVENYRQELRNLNDEAQEVVGGVAFDNFSSVKRRFHELILKADVGIIDVAWLKKEEHRARRDELTKERLNTIKVLDEEFHEIVESPTISSE